MLLGDADVCFREGFIDLVDESLQLMLRNEGDGLSYIVVG